ncbi:DUF4435 domain-containing protein [Variovorax paradoxus]|uniref:DUF4435 domain-containing protein n=1 Tax=Variovorax paradoxus TaxID=34073 RepID=UPI0029C843BB|nr:DUF4435 domain-containing protein [Variovorax paradoxus]WPH19851.1 DUF4435 domain-containing protein [Variovorax paradoxus]
MTRLVHSSGGFVRSLQMSSARIFAFVEGRLDRTFFDRIFHRELQATSIKHQVIAMKEIPDQAGGKTALLAVFRDFRRRGVLRTTAFGKSMVSVFLVDKDSDDYCRKQLRSPHLIYSKTYDLEAHLYSCADLHRALADASGTTLEQAKALLPDPQTWLANAVYQWRDWISLCLISQDNSLNCGCTFERVSQVNPDPLHPPDVAKIDEFKKILSQKMGVSEKDFEVLYESTRRSVDRSLRLGEPLRYFKGKWLSHLIQKFLETTVRPADANFNNIGDKLESTLVAQVAYASRCACCTSYSEKLTPLVALL